ncbi:MAG: right-handed parallel beta-helix repeat-containing protein [Alphaproteobacteria bacterium]|nr:right-handed parallel beta-helix repeat-containing protein [Alphaproteobacteria bacterium]
MRYGWLLTALLIAGCKDSDHDGVRDGKDCLPDDPRANPDATEVCDGIDNDCDGLIDEDVAIVAYLDQDRDGFGDEASRRRVCELPENGSTVAGDCDDADPAVNPDAAEICNELDDDCDGDVDEGVTRTYYADADDDGHGDPADTLEACFTPDGYAIAGDDCDDAEPAAWDGAAEVCDGIDNDCDGTSDEDLPVLRQWADLDGDGYGDPNAPVLACGAGVDVADNALDCDDTDPNVSPDAIEARGNGTDEDCDGYVDEYGVGPGNEYATVDDALAAAPDGSVIQLDQGLFTGTIDLTGRDVTLAGEGCDRTTVYADGDGSGITLDAGSVVGLTVSGGTGTDVDGHLTGGGILARGDVTIERVCATSNHAVSGGGIAAVAGTVRVLDCTISENSADGDGGGLFAGQGTTLFVVHGSRVLSNEATARGGGISVEGTSLQLTNSVVADNVCRDRGCGVEVDEVDLQTDPASSLRSNAVMVNDTFHGNRSTQVFGPGVGVAILSRGSDTEIRNTLFTGHEDPGHLIEASNGVGVGAFTTAFVGFRGNAGADVDLDLYVPDRVDGDPLFVLVDPTLPSTAWDFRLRDGSGMVDAGDTALQDPDGSRSDIGAFGGPNAPDGWDFGQTADSDADGMLDGWEIHYGTNRWVDDTASDDDGDGVTNLEEHDAGSDPGAIDTDGDGVEDGVELGAGDRPAAAWDQAPTADAGMDRFALVGRQLQLVGAGIDPNADTLAMTWTLVSQPLTSAAALGGAGGTVTLTPDQPGEYVLSLQVDDGSTTRTDEVVVKAWTGVVVPDDQPDPISALAVVPDGGAIALQPGIWRGTLDTSGRDVAVFGLGDADEVVFEGRGQGSVITASGGRLSLGHLTLQGGFAVQGGGLYADGLDGLDLLDVTFRENHATEGGGAFIEDSPTTARDLLVRGNVADDHGGGMALGELPDAYAFDGERLVFEGNRASSGGALYLHGGPSNTNTNYRLRSIVLLDNEATDGAGWWHSGGGSDVRADHVTAAYNRGTSLFWADEGRDVILGSTLDANELTVVFSGPNSASRATFNAFGGVWDDLPFPVSNPTAQVSDTIGRWMEFEPDLALVVDDGASGDSFVARGATVADFGFVEHLDVDGSRADAGACAGPVAWRDCVRFSVDSDGDGLPDAWEAAVGLVVGTNDATTDGDGDGANAQAELALGTSAALADTDLDGVADGAEATVGDDPLSDRDHRPQVLLPDVTFADVGTPAVLDATRSFDPDGDTLTWQWRIIESPPGSSAQIIGGTGQVVGLTPDVVGTWRIGAIASDTDGPSRERVVWVSVANNINVPGDFATLDEAYQAAHPNDTILVAAGVWTVSFDVLNKPITIAGVGVDQTILVPPPNRTVFTVGTSVDGPDRLHVRDLTVAGGTNQSGGGLYCNGGIVDVERALFRDNVGHAGGAMSLTNCNTSLVDTDFKYNHASSSGAAIDAQGGQLLITRGMMSQNEVDGVGGALSLTDTIAELYNVQLHRNRSTGQGAAIYLETAFAYPVGNGPLGSLLLDHVTLAGNIGAQGAVQRADETPLVVVNSLFVDNEAVGLTDQGGQVDLTMDHNGWSKNLQHTNPSGLSGGATDLRDPNHRLVTYDIDGELYPYDDEDLRLTARSPFRDMGSDLDRDGSAADAGAYGGPLAPDGWDDEFVDSDGDGMPDTWEIENGLDPATANAGGDPDGDGVANLAEFGRFSDPGVRDTDGDGVSDATDADNEDPADNAPTANAGNNINNATVGTPVVRSATATDPTNDPITYTWTLTDKPGRSALTTASLSGRTTATVTFTPDMAGMYELTVVASDAGGSGPPDAFIVRVPGEVVVPLDYADLEDAVFAAWDGGTVRVGPGTWPCRVDVAGRDVTIIGVGRDQTILDGGGRGRVLTVDAGENVALQDLTLRNGVASRGGHLLVEAGAASVTVDNVAFEGGRAGEGGSTYVYAGTLVAAGARWTDNLAAFRAGGVSINSGADFTVDQSLFANNQIDDNDGGAIRLFDSNLVASNIVLHDNLAYRGAGIYAVTGGTMSLDHVTATLNRGLREGAVLLVGVGTDWTVTNSLFAFNDGAPLVTDQSDSTYVQTFTMVESNPLGATPIYEITSMLSTEPVDGVQGNLIDNAYIVGMPGLTDDGDWTDDDWSLSASSDAVDAGNPADPRDTDNSRADMGAFGGPGGDFIP